MKPIKICYLNLFTISVFCSHAEWLVPILVSKEEGRYLPLFFMLINIFKRVDLDVALYTPKAIPPFNLQILAYLIKELAFQCSEWLEYFN
jgi:hypothetical protein